MLAPKLLQDFLVNQKDNSNVQEIRYEDLIDNSHDRVKELYNWLGLEFESSVLDYLNNKKFKGRYGDPRGIKKYSKAQKNNSNKFNEKLNDEFWNPFFQGYAEYLGDNFLMEYGNYSLFFLLRF